MLEIGGGGGVLTRRLLEVDARVWCWEVDPEWAGRLAELRGQPGGERLSLVLGDALDLPWERLPSDLLVTGNLPYNIATRLILDLLERSSVERAAFLVQREVADKLVAEPGSPDYGGLSVAVQAQAEPRRLGVVSKRDFRPPPKVDGAFVGLRRRPLPVPAGELAPFLATVRVAFAQRRKTLRNALASGWGRETADAVLTDLGWPSDTRAESLPVAAFVELHRARASVCRTEPDAQGANDAPAG